MLRLAKWMSFRHFTRSPARALLSVSGVALGVSVFVAIRLASGSAVTAFQDSVDALAGKANLQVTTSNGMVSEKPFPRLLKIDGVKSAWPVIQTLAANPGNPSEPLLIVGLDFFSDPRVFESASENRDITRNDILAMVADSNNIAVSQTYAQRNNWEKGDTVQLTYGGKKRNLVVRMLLPESGALRAYGGDAAFMDIAAAQEQFGTLGYLSRIDLIVEEAQLPSVADQVSELFPEAIVDSPESRGQQVESMVRSFRLNLLALSLVALFVGAFLIFNSVSLSVIQRRREIGILRSVGVKRIQILMLFLAEGFGYGMVGGLAGALGGIVLAHAALDGVSTTISSMYASVNATRVVIDPLTLIVGFGLGLLTAIASSIAPATEAALTPPGVVSREGSVMQRRSRSLLIVTIAAFVLLFSGYWSAVYALSLKSGILGFSSAALLMLGSALSAPALTVAFSRLVTTPVKWIAGTEGLIASRWVVYSLERTAVVIAALSAAVTMLIAVNMMVGSFRQTVEVWLNQTVKADLFIQPASTAATGVPSILPNEIVTILSHINDVESVEVLRATKTKFQGKLVELYGLDFGKMRDQKRLRFLQGDGQTLDSAMAYGQVLVSETFFNRFRIGTGQTLNLNTPSGSRNYTIAGVFYDYTSEAGLIMMHLPQYQKDFRDVSINTAAVYVEPGAKPSVVREALKVQLSGEYDVLIMLNRSLKQRALEIFDRTFAITNVLKVVAVAVAVMGVITTMAALILQRQREIGILRSVGASQSQLVRMTLVESCLIGLFAVVIGSVCGPAVALVLIKVINKLFFGWTIIPTLHAGWFLEAAAWVIAASLIAGIFPARLTSRTQPSLAVRNE